MPLRVALVGGPMYDHLYRLLDGAGVDAEVVVHADHPTLNRAVADMLGRGERLDLISTHSKYAPSQQQWLQPLDGLVDAGGLAPLAVDLCRFEGRLLCLPRLIDVRILWYRRDRLDAPPDTWGDVVEAGVAFGFPGRESGLFGTFFELVVGAGGRLFDDAGAPRIDSPEAVAAAELLAAMAARCPADLPGWHYDEVDRALRTPPPDEGAIFDPADQLLGAEREVLPPPDLPDGADELSEQQRLANTDSLGALTLFLMLAARIDAHEAMAATDLVAGDQLLVFTRDGATCAAIDLATASDADADDLEDTMQAWADAMPEEADVSVEREASVVAIESCDPGPEAEMGITAKGTESIVLPTTRLYVAAQAIQLGATDDEALCAAKTTTDALTVEQLADPDLDLSVFQQAQRDGLRACVR